MNDRTLAQKLAWLFGIVFVLVGILGFIPGITEDAPVVATGGLAELVAPHSQAIAHVDPFLTLEGLRLVWELNR